MKLKHLLAAYGDSKFRISGKDHTVYVDNLIDETDVIQKYGNCQVVKFWAYAYDDFDGFIAVHIKEDK